MKHPEHIEMDVKDIILRQSKRLTPLKLSKKDEFPFSTERYMFDERGFDTMTLQIIQYFTNINPNHGDGDNSKKN